MVTHSTQLPLLLPGALGAQCGVLGLLAQSVSTPASLPGLHVVALGCTQVCEALQLKPCAQSLVARHCTQAPPGAQRGVGEEQLASELQPELVTQMWFALQTGSAALVQSVDAMHCTQLRVLTSQTGAAVVLQSLLAKQPPVPTQTLFEQVWPVPQSRLATQATHWPLSGLQTVVPVSLEQSALVVQVPGSPAAQQFCAQCWWALHCESLVQVGAPTPHAEFTHAPLTQLCGDGQSALVVHVCSDPFGAQPSGTAQSAARQTASSGLCMDIDISAC